MIRLLIIADDFTGALDTAVQLVKTGAEVRVLPWFHGEAREEAEVLVINGETRHLSPRRAGEAVAEIAAWGARRGTGFFYKKTDSALRGNIGSELAALLRATGESCLYFIPAYPKIGRVTSGGVHTIQGTPVSETVFGRDPFEPVRTSRVAELAGAGGVPAELVPEGEFPSDPGRPGPRIWVFDATRDETLRDIARRTAREGRVRLLAGCAGFGEYLAQMVPLRKDPRPGVLPGEKLVVISGSLNPITLAQVEAAQNRGFALCPVTGAAEPTVDYLESPAGRSLLEEAQAAYHGVGRVILQAALSGGTPGKGRGERARRTFQRNLGRVAAALLDRGLVGTYVFIGGDTLMGAMDQIGCRAILPAEELEPGVVLCKALTGRGELPMVSKSGGLGSREVLSAIEAFLKKKRKQMEREKTKSGRREEDEAV